MDKDRAKQLIKENEKAFISQIQTVLQVDARYQNWIRRYLFRKQGQETFQYKINKLTQLKKDLSDWLRLLAADRRDMKIKNIFLDLKAVDLKTWQAWNVILLGIDLSYAYLSYAYLRNADLRNAKTHSKNWWQELKQNKVKGLEELIKKYKISDQKITWTGPFGLEQEGYEILRRK